jgi:hypothetical protein
LASLLREDLSTKSSHFWRNLNGQIIGHIPIQVKNVGSGIHFQNELRIEASSDFLIVNKQANLCDFIEITRARFLSPSKMQQVKMADNRLAFPLFCKGSQLNL